MAYTTEAKIKSMLRDIIISATSVVTTSDVTEFISESDAVIDAKLSPHYTTPITGVEALKLVGLVSKLMVAHTIKTILETVDQKSDKVQDVQTNLGKKAEKMLDDMIPWYNEDADRWEEALIPLTDAVRRDRSPKTASIFRSQRTGKVPALAATIIKGGDNW